MPGTNRHGPQKLLDYLDTHHTILQQFVWRGFLADNPLELSKFGLNVLEMSGELRCLGGIVLTVRKGIKALEQGSGNPEVQTTTYNYNARIQGLGNILRYDSPHPHRPYHHVHRFDVFAGDKEGTITEIRGTSWPHLGEVLHELEAFYFQHYDLLEDADR